MSQKNGHQTFAINGSIKPLAPMSLHQALTLAALVLTFEAETTDTGIWRHECEQSARLLTSLKNSLCNGSTEQLNISNNRLIVQNLEVKLSDQKTKKQIEQEKREQEKRQKAALDLLSGFIVRANHIDLHQRPGSERPEINPELHEEIKSAFKTLGIEFSSIRVYDLAGGQSKKIVTGPVVSPAINRL